MKTILSLGLAAAAFAAAEVASGTNAEVATEETKGNKSIVPSKYAGKYKNGGSDALALFINEQSKDKDGNFEFAYYFDLCRKNGVKEEQVAKYEGLVADKANNPGIEGRARMTLRNMLAAIVRKEGKVIDRDGKEHAMDLPKPAASGAAAKAQAAASATTTGTETGTVETVETEDTDEGGEDTGSDDESEEDETTE